MPKTRTHIHSFNVGEVGLSGLARIDQERIRLAAETQENIFGRVIGKGQFRPGTKYITGTKSNNRPKLIAFAKSITDTAILELTTGKLRVLVDDALVTRGSVTSTVGNSSFATASATITMTIATPAVVTWTAHGFSAGQQVSFKTDGALPTGVTAGTIYYVQSTGLTTDTFRISATDGGADIDTTGAQSGTHTGDANWITTISGGGISTISGGSLTMYCPSRGGTAMCKQAVTTSSANSEHALRIEVTRGPVFFRCGSADSYDDYITESSLDEGSHSLTFTPTSSPYYIQFFTRSTVSVIVASIAVEAAGTLELDTPWSTDDLRSIRWDRSKDVIFLGCGSWQQRKLERRNNPRSWSIVKYKANDGPFTSSATASVKLTPGALSGNTTLTSDRPFFRSSHVGALFRLYHDTQTVQTTLSAENTFSDAIRINGTGAGRAFTFSTTGTWVGTLSRQYSFDGPDTGFSDYLTTTSNLAESTYNDGLDNQIIWHRYGFKTGNYTSGSVTVNLSFRGGGHGICRVVEYTSPTVVQIEVLETFQALSSTDVWYEGDWSERRGWPTAVGFHDGRLGWARGDKFWLSGSDAFYTFGVDDDESIVDSSPISRNIETEGGSDTANWMMSLQRLLIGTYASESAIRSNSLDEPITPTGTQAKAASTQGSSAVAPVKADKRGFYVQRSGNTIYQLGYNFEQQDYDSENLMEWHEFLGGDGILELAMQRQPDTYLWGVRADGQCVVLLYEPSQKVMGWQRFISDGADGEVESIAVLPSSGEDKVYLSIKRTIASATVRYIEVLQPHSTARGGAGGRNADSGIYTAGPATSVTAAHLASETGLIAWATNSDGDQVALTGLTANGSGVVPLGGTYTAIWLGLPYRGRYKSARLAYGAQGASALLSPKRVGPIGLLLEETHPDAITYGPDFDHLDAMPRIEGGTDVVLETADYGERAFPFDGVWDTDSRVCLEMNAPYPATVLGLVITVEVSE